MDIVTVLLIVIGVILAYVVYLQIRLLMTSRPTYVVVPPVAVPPANEGGPGCLAYVVAILLIVGLIVVGIVMGLIPIG
jgi:hypothetical protein